MAKPTNAQLVEQLAEANKLLIAERERTEKLRVRIAELEATKRAYTREPTIRYVAFTMTEARERYLAVPAEQRKRCFVKPITTPRGVCFGLAVRPTH